MLYFFIKFTVEGFCPGRDAAGCEAYRRTKHTPAVTNDPVHLEVPRFRHTLHVGCKVGTDAG